jgi:2-polyprenyl-6-methoxyphenol hydroxylase-like FAD-dependent oxidoreductase
MTSIGIVGTGISGLQLALTLQHRGVDTIVYAEKTPDQMRAGRLPNSVVRFAKTIERERALGAPHWVDSASARLDSMHVSILDTPVAFVGQLEQPASGVDFRVYLPRLLEDYADRGGRVVLGARTPEDVVAGVDDHDLTVVATGRDSVDAFFPRDEARSPYSAPQRRLCVMHVHGIAPLDPAGASFTVVPGVGEIFTFPFLSALGSVTCLAFEAIPGGPLEPITRLRYDEDPAAFEAQMLELLERFAPAMVTRIDRAEFGVTGPLDLLQGALTPVVRRPYCEVAPGRFVVAVGDAYVTNDPICGQGANLGSTNAAILADAICRDVAFDDRFCRGLARDMWAAAEPVTNWNNSFLAPPPPHVEAILGAAAQSPAVADAFSNLWADPAAMWRAIATPERAAAFLASVSAPPAALAA